MRQSLASGDALNPYVAGQNQLVLRADRMRRLRRRFLMVSVAALAVLASALGVSFLADSGTASLSVTGGSNNFVYPVANGNLVPSTNVTALRYTAATGINASH
ncbi:MAG TPA: hypothetical protein VKP14_01770, partial [Gaiellaceae bacterium]|nr:hypothetical protein [Gaiellaceae bacterium]